MRYLEGLAEIQSAIVAPSAALAAISARQVTQQTANSNAYDVPAYPIVYGENVWVKRAMVISERKIGNQYERIQVLSVGELEEVDINIYNDCCQVIGTIDPKNLRLGAKKQDKLTTAFYIPCHESCCNCPGPGDGIVYSDVGDRIDLTIDTTAFYPPPEDPDAPPPVGVYAWTVLIDGVPSGTVWANGPGATTLAIAAPITANVALQPTTTATPPTIQLLSDPGSPDVTVGIFRGPIAAAPLPPTTGEYEILPSLVGVKSDIDASLSGLACVLTLTDCAYPPSFKIKKGRKIPQILYATTKILGEELDPEALPLDATELQNVTTGQTVAASAIATLKANAGDTIIATTMGSSQYLPDVWLDLATNVWGGLNDVFRPQYFADYPQLHKARDFCVARNYTFAGVVHRQPFSQFTQYAAPQSGCIVTRRGNRTGLYPDFPQERAVRLFTGTNANNFHYVWEPWDEHATNRLIVHWRNPEKCDRATLIAESTTLSADRESYIETPVDWNFVGNLPQAEALAIQYFNSIRFQRSVCYFRTALIDHQIDPGNVIIVTNPTWEIGADYSGAVVNSSGSKVTVTWEPVIATATGHTGTGNSIVDDRQDFTKLVSVGDYVLAGDTAAKVTSVAATVLELDKAIAPDANYRVIDATVEGMSWCAYNPLTGDMYQPSTAITAGFDETKRAIFYELDVELPPGCVFAIAKQFTYYRISDIEPIDDLDLAIRGTIWFPNHDQPINTRLIR
jgi:hypothetical protein